MPRIFITATAASVLAVASLCSTPATAEDAFPAKPIRIILPLPAGSAPDVITRVVGEQMTQLWGQQVITENRPGAGGLLAAQAVAAAPADGYTLLLGPSSVFRILPVQNEKLPFDINRDLTMVGMVLGNDPLFIAASSKLGVSTFAEFMALAKSKPGTIAIGTNGAGTLPHYAGLALVRKGNLPITIVPYNQGGTSAAIADILGGRIHATIESLSGLRGHLQSGDMKLIGVMSLERDPDFPDVPTVAASIPGFSAVGFLTLAAPAGTPARIVARLNDGLRQALETPKVRQRFQELAVRPVAMTPTQTAAFISDDEKLWWPIVKEFAQK